jgi:hypothetical protein
MGEVRAQFERTGHGSVDLRPVVVDLLVIQGEHGAPVRRSCCRSPTRASRREHPSKRHPGVTDNRRTPGTSRFLPVNRRPAQTSDPVCDGFLEVLPCRREGLGSQTGQVVSAPHVLVMRVTIPCGRRLLWRATATGRPGGLGDRNVDVLSDVPRDRPLHVEHLAQLHVIAPGEHVHLVARSNERHADAIRSDVRRTPPSTT